MPLGVIDLLQVGIIANGFNSLLQWNNLVVAGHNGNDSELQTLGQVHRCNGNLPAAWFKVLVKNLER